MVLINTPLRSAGLGGLFGGLTYGVFNLCTSLAASQAVNVAISNFLTPVLGAALGCYAGLFIPALLAVGIGALMGYLLFQVITNSTVFKEQNNESQTASIGYDYDVSVNNSFPPFISFQEFTNKEIYRFIEDADENEMGSTIRL